MKIRKLSWVLLSGILLVIVLSINAQAQPRVNVMPGNDPGNVYPYTWPGRAITVWGNVHGGTPPYTYVLDFGDGTAPVGGTVTNPKYISASHTYTTMGPKLATLSVTDAGALSDHETVEIEVAPRTFEVEVNAAVEDGLRYLYLQQQGDGRWGDMGCDNATTALALLAFENQGHLPINDYDEDIYAEYVKAGLDFLTGNLAIQSMTVQPAGDPEEIVSGNTDANGIGIYPMGCSTGYETGMVMMAMVGAGPLGSIAPDLVAPNGPAGVIGRTYRELVTDMVDYCAWSQNEAGGSLYRGGWRYNANDWSSDNSVSQWPPIGLEAAETNWGISAPDYVKSELELWINASQINGGAYDGGFYYDLSWYSSIAPTGAGLCEMAYCDISQNDSRFQRALNHLEYVWNTVYNKGFYYGMYAIAKGCRIAVDDFGDLSEINYIGSIEWYPDYATYLVGIQNSNGSWPQHDYGQILDHSWALLVLQQTVVGGRPVAMINAPASVPPDFSFDADGSGSFHMDSERQIVQWLWDFDNTDGVDWNTPDAMGKVVEDWTYSLALGDLADTLVITLRVSDDSDSTMTDIAEHTIIVNFDNHAPVADANGPYAAKIGEIITFDGTGSYDPDESAGDFLVSYSWDIDGDGNFGDCTDPICYQSWGYLYSGYVGLVVTDTYGATSDTSISYVTVWTSEMDVSVHLDDISFSMPAPQPGNDITITAVIKCGAQSDPVSDILVRFYDGDPDIAVDQIGDDQVLPYMIAGDAIPVSVPYHVGDTLPRQICVWVDPQGSIEEYDEENNEALKVIEPVWWVDLDIKPCSCPNPLNVKMRETIESVENSESYAVTKVQPGVDGELKSTSAVIPVAILGTADFEVAGIDPATVLLMGVPALRWNIEDVSMPVDENAEECECTADGPDGFPDLTLKFDRASVVTALGQAHNGEIIPLTATGLLYTGMPLKGTDCVVIRGDNSIGDGLASSRDGTPQFAVQANYPNPFNASTVIRFSLAEASLTRLDVYDILGRRVATLLNAFQPAGNHEIQWDGTDDRGAPLSSGVYFYRLAAGEFMEVKKMMMMK